ncbi:MAG TPA: acyl-CoA dehydrogenase family protein [Deltaproteobacteria bacterium]|nr:acyl-CoA dehydrogenase family protein [Deltaproteobacteria bacterium]HOM29304.1 acyl-CoA dehydrogenase family protein [Deltaproteobacteria bacterium]HPP79496.1 acyl-CoA dehydrogenase family protein [Deltaproteobacteria bacterium]
MDYELEPSRVDFLKALGAHLAERVAPRRAQLDSCGPEERARLMRDNIAGLGTHGFLAAMSIGNPPDLVGHYLALEETAKACPATCLSARASAFLCAGAISLFGSPGAKETYLPRLLSGEAVGALAYSEPGSGSDLGALGAVAESDAGVYLVDGEKDIVVNAPIAEVFVVLARTPEGPSLLVVEGGARGLEIGPCLDTLGIRGAPVGGVRMRRCEAACLLGREPGMGLEQLERLLSMGAVGAAALCVGIAHACMEISTERAKSRSAFGKPIGMFQDVGFKLADMFTLVDLSRLLALRAAWAFDTGERDAPVRAACAKLFSAEACSKVANWGMQIFAGHGYLAGSPIERLYRDARFGEICERTSEILRLTIANEELDRFAGFA